MLGIFPGFVCVCFFHIPPYPQPLLDVLVSVRVSPLFLPGVLAVLFNSSVRDLLPRASRVGSLLAVFISYSWYFPLFTLVWDLSFFWAQSWMKQKPISQVVCRQARTLKFHSVLSGLWEVYGDQATASPKLWWVGKGQIRFYEISYHLEYDFFLIGHLVVTDFQSTYKVILVSF